MPARTLIIGDIHGCIDELRSLLLRLEASSRDRILCVGDLLCKGPDSRAVLDWAMNTANVRCILGNHEARFLNYWRKGKEPWRKSYDPETFDQLKDRWDAYMHFVEGWPLWIEDPQFLLVHAGIDSREPSLASQDPEILYGVRNLPGTNTPWFEAYRSEKLAVFGHWARREPVLRPNAIGLDTGCVYGGALTALVLPGRHLVQVPARRAYRKKEGW